VTSPWQTLPTFTDGVVVDEGDLDPITHNLDLLRRSRRILAGRILSTGGPQYVTSGATELNMPKLQISNITIEANRAYFFGMIFLVNASVANDSFYFRIRQNTALTGAVLVGAPFIVNVSGRDDLTALQLPWKPAAGGTMSFHCSIKLELGTGICNVFGNLTSAVWIEKAGDDGTEWTLAP
jgi:hypothetical protein